jgi:formylglycine-generating enzyme required for sulfatase activity
MTPDLLLLVSEQRSADGSTYLSFQAKTRKPRHGLSFARFESETLSDQPLTHFKQLFREIERAAQAQVPMDERLESHGVLLFEQLFPEKLRRKLWFIHGSLKTVQIHSNESWIPWELLKLQDPEAPAASGPFLVERFALTRWLNDCGDEATRLPLRRLAFVAPQDSSLLFAGAESRLLKTLESRNRKVVKIPALRQNVIQALASGEYDAWHFTGHGFAAEDNPDLWKLELDMGQTLSAADLYGQARTLGIKNPPLVFLNACHSGRGAASLTGLGGFAYAFLKAGAGAFIGSHWSLNDNRAYSFADAFYTSFLGGDPIGEAVRKARQQLRDAYPGSPDWLAYTVFADPLATCESRSKETPPQKSRPQPDTRPGRAPSPKTPTGSVSPAAKTTTERPSTEPDDFPDAEAAQRIEEQAIEEQAIEEPQIRERVHEKDGTCLVYVPGGQYQVGDDVHDWSRPLHTIRLSPFWIGRSPVTNEQYARFLDQNEGHPEPTHWNDERLNRPQSPVVGVSFADAEAYCRWAGLELPSEAQWEAAARGHDRRAYPWGEDPPSPVQTNFAGKVGTTSDVGSHLEGAGPFGTADQAGNVWEWCRDHWSSAAYKDRAKDDLDPVSYANPDVRVVRGGAWNSPAKDLRAANRDRRAATKRLPTQGFRCVLPDPDP